MHNFLEKYPLLTGELRPYSWCLCFFEATAVSVATQYLDWLKTITPNKEYEIKHKKGSLNEIVSSVFPIGNDNSHAAFIPTKSNWTLYVDSKVENGHYTWITPLFVLHRKEKLNCKAIRVIARPDIKCIKEHDHSVPRYLSLDFLTPDTTSSENNIWGVKRSISLAYSNTWKLFSTGIPFEFEDTEQYITKRGKKKFTFSILDSYLKSLEINAFNEDFYIPNETEAVTISSRQSQQYISSNSSGLYLEELPFRNCRYDFSD